MYNTSCRNAILFAKKIAKPFIAIFLSLCLVFGIVALSFSPVYADDNGIYSRSSNKYSFTELFNMFMSNVIGWGTVYTSSNVQLLNIPGAAGGLLTQEIVYVLGVYTYNSSSPIDNLKTWLTTNTSLDFDLMSWRECEDKNGYKFYVNKNMDTVIVSNGNFTWRHTFNSNGNAIQSGGGSSGVSRENNYYTQSTNNNYNYDYGTTIEEQILDNSTTTLNNIGNNSAVNFGSGYVCYSPENKTYYAFDTTNNTYYTTTNNYTYNTVNYYMPGSDVPLSQYNYYFELPDGRNSATLTPDDIKGINVDFDVVQYETYATDPYQYALYHLNGDLSNSAYQESSFEWTNGASYTFVDTGTDFDGALYISGDTSHSAVVNLPTGSFSGDFTFQCRWYQELSSSTVSSGISFGNNTLTSNTYGASFTWNGTKISSLRVGTYVSTPSNATPASLSAGQWHTFTLCRNTNTYMLFLDGLQVLNVSGSVSFPFDKIYLSFGLDNNVHYIDEIAFFAGISLYTSNFIPRLSPWDSNNVYVVPSDVVDNSIAIQVQDEITNFQLGGVRPSLPSRGYVYVSVENGVVTSIQYYTGYMWQPTLGAVYFNGHWFDLDGFNFHQFENDIDAPFIIPSTSTDDNGGGGFSFWQLVYELIKPVLSLLVSLVTSLASLLSSFFTTLLNLFTGLINGIGNFFSFLTPIGDFFTATWSAVPPDIIGIVTGGFIVVVLVATLKLFL